MLPSTCRLEEPEPAHPGKPCNNSITKRPLISPQRMAPLRLDKVQLLIEARTSLVAEADPIELSKLACSPDTLATRLTSQEASFTNRRPLYFPTLSGLQRVSSPNPSF